MEEEEHKMVKEFNDHVEEGGASYKIPYQKVNELVFNNVKKEELVDAEHAARLQYRLILLDAVIMASVEFAARRIRVTYNPKESENLKEKISRQEVMGFLAKQGIMVSEKEAVENELDYYRDIYSYQYNPPSVREHQPYGYTPEEWRRMKNDYERKKAQWETNKKSKFHEWQKKYLQEHPELAAEQGTKQDI